MRYWMKKRFSHIEKGAFPGARIGRLTEAHSDRSPESSRGGGNCGLVKNVPRVR